MKILVFDNYDSFTYNLVFMIRELGYSNLSIKRNDQINLEEIGIYDKILLSPGPGLPDSAGIMKELIQFYAGSKSILGICLGHQGIAEVFGATLFNLTTVLHGVAGKMLVLDQTESIFANLPDNFIATHYHSWAVRSDSLPNELVVTAKDENEMIMGISHSRYDVKGLQFHPESILTQYGSKMLDNWIKN